VLRELPQGWTAPVEPPEPGGDSHRALQRALTRLPH
jgi:hypothetical protein